MSFETHPDQNAQLLHVRHISHLFKLEEKTLTRVNILPQLLLHIHSDFLTLLCRITAEELHFFMAITICVY